jgi:hypothetical protein
VKTQKSYYQDKAINTWSRVMHRLVYLPGAMLLIYGCWLSLTA